MNDALDQQTFRQLLRAFSYPGQVERTEDALNRVLSALLDREAGCADPHGLLGDDDRVRLQVRRTAVEDSAFVLVRGDLAPALAPSLGTLAQPDLGATLIVRVAKLDGPDALSLALRGPGIESSTTLRVAGLHPAWLEARAGWNAGFPMGVDLLLVDAAGMAAIPRTTQVTVKEMH